MKACPRDRALSQVSLRPVPPECLSPGPGAALLRSSPHSSHSSCSAHSLAKLSTLCSDPSPSAHSDTGSHGFPFSRPSQLTGCNSSGPHLQTSALSLVSSKEDLSQSQGLRHLIPRSSQLLRPKPLLISRLQLLNSTVPSFSANRLDSGPFSSTPHPGFHQLPLGHCTAFT